MRNLVSFGAALAGMVTLGTLHGSPAAACDYPAVRAVQGCEVQRVRLASDTVLRGTADVYRVRVSGGERVRLSAETSGNTVLVVLDECGHVVARDEDEELAVVRFTPARGAVYTVKLVNRESYAVDYVLTAG